MLTKIGLTIWSIKCVKDGKVLWEVIDQPNILTNQGEKAIVDCFFRKKDSIYFLSGDYFYAGLYRGTISESTTLATIPNEPPIGKGYIRQAIERSDVGFPTIEEDNGDWRVVSKEVSITASDGDIGPVNGAFLATSEDNSGVLICAISTKGGINQTIVAGSTCYFTIKYKQK